MSKRNEYTAELWQDGMMVASVNAPDPDTLAREIAHYAAMYSQDGPVTVKKNYAAPLDFHNNSHH